MIHDGPYSHHEVHVTTTQGQDLLAQAQPIQVPSHGHRLREWHVAHEFAGFITQENAQAIGVGSRAPGISQEQQKQWIAMHQKIAQLQGALQFVQSENQESQFNEARVREIEQQQLRAQQIEQQRHNMAQDMWLQQEAAILAQHCAAADQAAADQLRAQQDQSVEWRQRIESEKQRVRLEALQLQHHKQLIASKEHSLLDRELQFKTQGGEYLADDKRQVQTHEAEQLRIASMLSFKESQLRDKEAALQARIDAAEARALQFERASAPPLRPEMHLTPESGKASEHLTNPTDPLTAGQTVQAAATALSQPVVAVPGENKPVSAFDIMRLQSGIPHGPPLMPGRPLLHVPAITSGSYGVGATLCLAASPKAHTPRGLPQHNIYQSIHLQVQHN